jgi:hypothetical protein
MRVKLYLVHGQDLMLRCFQAVIVLSEDEMAARNAIAHENRAFHVDQIEIIKDYPQLRLRPAVLARITLPEPE